MMKYLTPSKLKLNAKGINSVKSRVININEINNNINHNINHNSFVEAISNEYIKTYKNDIKNIDIETITQDDMDNNPEIKLRYEELNDYNFKYGATPKFNIEAEIKFDFGYFNVFLFVENGNISSIKI